ncbi:unnamed protein product [Spodoptera littoralis]|uniref:NTF2 domain-containing protein n=1 Tax=Spodoptera littoralis TaxID=7109 RepID=A0A9P0MYI9_SPOLI|nr:unnamed protein product [Spodoptera littoralis]CAH1635974.1 unnamed protein product [Spodoptera littoralis]
MSLNDHELQKYQKFLLNRQSSYSKLAESIENCLKSEDKVAKHFLHKVMIHNWQHTLHQLFERMHTYFGVAIIPINCSTQGDIATFYTSSLTVISEIIKFDFMFPFCRTMYNIDILFYDKTSIDFFGKMITVEEVVNSVVSQRFNELCELDLSNFCDDAEFTSKRIFFFKISLLANFKILMLRMGRDTKILNLSHNNLSVVPLDVLNFFIKADLTAVNFSHNNIPSIAELSRVSSKIEKLWLEGNPLCADLDPVTYVKTVTMKFPRLTELDGIPLNQNGIVYPFYRNYLCVPDRRTKMLVEKFVTLYFSNYDQPPKIRKKKIEPLYDENAVFTLTCDLSEADKLYYHYTQCSRNMMNPCKRPVYVQGAKTYTTKQHISNILSTFPETLHDRSTFTVDVLVHDKKSLQIVIDGIFKEKYSGTMFQFRRTFIFTIYTIRDNSVYHITNDMYSITYPSKEIISTSFLHPIRNMNSLSLINPTPEKSDALINAFQHLTQLRKTEVELRLKYHGWDIRDALKSFMVDAKSKKMPSDLFMDSDFSDSSSLLDEVD